MKFTLRASAYFKERIGKRLSIHFHFAGEIISGDLLEFDDEFILIGNASRSNDAVFVMLRNVSYIEVVGTPAIED